MPRLAGITEAPPVTVDFIVSVPLDLMNAMYFTYLAKDHEGLDGWPTETRKNMAPDLLAEFDFLYEFPMGEPGLLGTLTDMLWSQPQTWPSVDALLDHVRNLPLDTGSIKGVLGIQGLAFNISTCESNGEYLQDSDLTRDKLVRMLQEAGADVSATLAQLDQPEVLRDRLVSVIERVYNEHYKADLPRRLPCLELSVAEHRGNVTLASAPDLLRQLSGRPNVCFEPGGICEGPWDRVLFAPSMDMGPYMSCAEIGSVHGMFYPCESRFINGDSAGDDTVRLARVYKALADEQRLRILDILREREMYAQEVVDRTGLHQSMVSRHLGFLRAVGLVRARREGTMKFYSLNSEARQHLSKALEMFPEGGAQ